MLLLEEKETFKKFWRESIETHRLQGALQITIAVILTSSISLLPQLKAHSQFSFWAPLTACLVIERGSQGGSFRVSSLRIQGTVLGAFFGYLVLLLNSETYFIIVALLVWIAITTYPRASSEVGVAWAVSGFSAALTIIGGSDVDDYQRFVFDRIEQTVLGVAIVVVVTLAWPERAADQLHREMVNALQDARFCLVLLYEDYIHSIPSSTSPTAVHDISKEAEAERLVSEKLKTLSEVLSRSEKLIVEASLEPQLWRPPFDTKSYVKILQALKKLTSSLKLTLRVLQWRSGREDDMLLKTVSTISVLSHEPSASPERTALLLAPLKEALKGIEMELFEAMDGLCKAFQNREKAREYHFAILNGSSLHSEDIIIPFREEVRHAVEQAIRKNSGMNRHIPMANRDILAFYSLVECFIQLVNRVETLSSSSISMFQKEFFAYEHKNFL